MPGAMIAAEVLALGRDDVERGRRAEVDDSTAPPKRSRTATALTSRSAPISRGLSKRIAMPVFSARADDEHLVAEVARAPSPSTRAELGHRRGDDRGLEVVEAVAAQLEQVAQRRAELVGGRLAHGGEAPVLDQLLAAEGAEVGLRVPDVDDEQHRRRLCSPCRDATRRSCTWSPARTRAPPSKLALRAQVDRLPARRAAAARCTPLIGALRFGGAPFPGMLDRTARSSSARARSCAGSTSSCPSRRCCPPTPSARAKVVEAERWGDEVFQPIGRGACMWPRLRATRGAMAELRRARQAAAAARRVRPAQRARDRPRSSGAQQRPPTRPCAPTSPRCPRSSTDRRLDRRRRARRRAPNAADLQIGSTMRLLLTLGDLRAADRGRARPAAAPRAVPAGRRRHARRVAARLPSRRRSGDTCRHSGEHVPSG